MADFLALTMNNGFCGQQIVYINPDTIARIVPVFPAGLAEYFTLTSRLHFTDGTKMEVQESADSIMAQLAEKPHKNGPIPLAEAPQKPPVWVAK